MVSFLLQLDKECFVKVNDSLVVTPGGETIILPEDSTSIPIETSADDNEGERRLSSRKNTSRGILRISQLFLLCAAIFSVAMGITVAMHRYFTVYLSFNLPMLYCFSDGKHN